MLQDQSPAVRNRVVKAGFVGAGALTLTWWTLLACGVWRAIEWMVA